MKLPLSLCCLIVASTAFGDADLRAMTLEFANVPASTTGEFRYPATQSASLLVQNYGNEVVGSPHSDCSSGGFCASNFLVVSIDGHEVETYLAQVPPGRSAQVNLGLPNGMLRHCGLYTVHIDVRRSVGQAGSERVFANDRVRMRALERGRGSSCLIDARPGERFPRPVPVPLP